MSRKFPQERAGHGQTNGALRSGDPGYGRRVILVALVIVALGLSGLSQAQPVSGRFEVRSAYAESVDGVYYVNATVDYTLSEAAIGALKSGVPLTLELEIELNHARRYLPDPTVAVLKQRYELQWHALTERYVVRNINSEEQESYASLATAVRRLGQVADLPVIDATLLDPDKRYEIRMRAVLDIRTLSGPLRLLAVFFDDWRLESDWYTWPLRP